MVSLRIPTVLGSPLSFASCQTNLVYDGVVGLHGHVEGVALADVGRGICSDRDLKTAFPNHANLKKKVFPLVTGHEGHNLKGRYLRGRHLKGFQT